MKCAQFQALQTGLAHYEHFQDKHQRQKAEGAQVGHSAARDIQAERGARLRERADSSSASSHSDAGPPGQVHFTTGWTPHALVSARCSLPTSYVLVALGTMPASSSTVCTPRTRPTQTLGCHYEYEIDAHGAYSIISLCISELRLCTRACTCAWPQWCMPRSNDNLQSALQCHASCSLMHDLGDTRVVGHAASMAPTRSLCQPAACLSRKVGSRAALGGQRRRGGARARTRKAWRWWSSSAVEKYSGADSWLILHVPCFSNWSA